MRLCLLEVPVSLARLQTCGTAADSAVPSGTASVLSRVSGLVWDAALGRERDGKGGDPAESRTVAGGLQEVRAVTEEGTAWVV